MGKLLLKCDGVLIERWNPLENSLPADVIPPRWDAVHVGKRFADALQVLLKMPLSRTFPRGFACCWPTYRHEWNDMLAMLSADDGGEAIALLAEERNYVKIPPSAVEISAMERALAWPGDYLRGRDPALVHGFNLCALADVRQVSVDDVVRHGRRAGVLSPTRWRELGLAAAGQIARGLVENRIQVF